jgi:hypothetical protein
MLRSRAAQADSIGEFSKHHRVSSYRVRPGMVYSYSAIEMNLRADPIMALDLNPCADEMSKTTVIMREEGELQLHDRHGLAQS